MYFLIFLLENLNTSNVNVNPITTFEAVKCINI